MMAGGVEIRRQTKTINYACYYWLYAWLIHVCAPGVCGQGVSSDFLSAQQRERVSRLPTEFNNRCCEYSVQIYKSAVLSWPIILSIPTY